MSQTTLRITFKVDGVAVDPTSALLSDPTGAYGVKRTDTGAVVVADGTAMVKESTGVYSYTFTDPAAGLTYNYWVEFVYDGATYRVEKNQSGPESTSVAKDGYLSVAEAAVKIASLPQAPFAKYLAGSADDKQRWLNQASREIDRGMRYQGRKYDLATPQVREFPRMAYEVDVDALAYPVLMLTSAQAADVIWDWDAATNTAVVPPDVYEAELWQAAAIADGSRDKYLDAQHDGIRRQAHGTVSTDMDGSAPVLCRRALDLLRQYELRTGQIR